MSSTKRSRPSSSHKSRSRATRLLTALVVLGGAPAAHAFSEDLCVKAGVIVDCMQAAACAPGGNSAACSVNIVWDGAQATSAATGRSMLHVDSTYAIAQALGFRWDIAYWIAAYNEVTDQGKYDPLDRCGRALSDATLTPVPITGFLRTKPATGGVGFHFVTPFSAAGDGSDLGQVDGEHPDLDSHAEGMLGHVRRWLYAGVAGQGAAPMCVDGFTTRAPLASAPFMNSACYAASSSASLIRGEMPLFSTGQARVPFLAKQGNQVLLTDATSGQTSYYDALGGLLASGSGELKTGSDAGSSVPEVIAKAGFYLHMVQDRISHSACTDASYVRYSAPFYEYRFEPGTSDPSLCTQDTHAVMHYEELGKQQLPERTLAALEYTYDELKELADALHSQHPGWFTGRYAAPVSKAALIRSGSTLGPLANALRKPSALLRQADLQASVYATYALQPMPGHSASVTCN